MYDKKSEKSRIGGIGYERISRTNQMWTVYLGY
jgi:hypothetical protein